MSRRFARNLPATVRILGVVGLLASAFVACGGVAGSDGSSGSSGSSNAGRTPKVHRADAVACVLATPPVNPNIPEAGRPGSCSSNAECTEGRNGRCVGDSRNGYRCTYDTCAGDSDCGGGVCACDGTSSTRCLAGGCQVDSNCGASGFCSPTLGSCGRFGGVAGYYCHTPEDECVDDEDCSGTGMFGGRPYCAYEKSIGHWKCSTAECAG